MPGKPVYESLFVSAGRNGWDIAEPGDYTVQMILHLDEQDVVSNSLRVRVAPPHNRDEEALAQDFFSDDVGRILTFDGSQFIVSGNDILHETAERLSGRRVSLHAAVALGSAMASDYKLLSLEEAPQRAMAAAAAAGATIKVRQADADAARLELTTALIQKPDLSAETLGHIDYKYYVDRFTDWMAREGEPAEATKYQDDLHKTLAARGVKQEVLNQIQQRRESYGKAPVGAAAEEGVKAKKKARAKH